MIPFESNGTFRTGTGGHGLRRLAVRGAVATLSTSGVALGAQVVSTVILARLLTPSDFGVVTMVTTFSLLVANCGFNGFTEAILQCEEIDNQTASNLFWLNTAIGLVLAIAFAAAGSWLARFYENPLVAKIALGLSIGIFIATGCVVHLALLQRAMRFASTSVNDVVGRAVYAVVAIVLAFRGWSYWALVAGIVAQQLSVTLGSWLLCPWVPSFPRRTGKTGPMIRFAANVYGRFAIRYCTQNIDNVLVGWRFSAVALGFYKRAYDLFALSASQLTAPLNHVALASMSRLNNDRDRLIRYFSGLLGIIAFVGMAMGADLTLVGKDVVRLVLGSQWAESGRIFELFGPGIGVMLLSSTVGWIHLAIGNPGRWLRWSVFELAITTSLFVVALPWGPAGIALAWSVAYWILLVPGFWYAGRPIGFGVSALIINVWRYATAALLAGLTTVLIVERTQFWSAPTGPGAALEAMVIISAIFMTIYFGMVILLHGGLGPFRQLAGLLKELSPAKKIALAEPEPVEGIR